MKIHYLLICFLLFSNLYPRAQEFEMARKCISDNRSIHGKKIFLYNKYANIDYEYFKTIRFRFKGVLNERLTTQFFNKSLFRYTDTEVRSEDSIFILINKDEVLKMVSYYSKNYNKFLSATSNDPSNRYKFLCYSIAKPIVIGDYAVFQYTKNPFWAYSEQYLILLKKINKEWTVLANLDMATKWGLR